MYYNKVVICGVDTSKLPVLNENEQNKLLKKVRMGDNTARKRLIDGNLRLVLSVVQRFNSRCEEADDLFQVGCIGLIKAIDNFNTEFNLKFSTYAVPMIIGEVRRYLRDNSIIKVSRSMRDIAYKALQAREALSNKLTREPTIDEIKQYLCSIGVDVDKQKITNALDAISHPISLYEPVLGDGDESVYMLDKLSDDKEKDENWLENISINEAILHLDKREKRIIDLRFFHGKTQMEIADEIGISQAQVSRLEKNALMKIKNEI